MSSKAWFLYILRCFDDSFYTGITKDIKRRIEEHNSDDLLGARYTRARRPVVLVYKEVYKSRSEAARREYAVKQLSREAKEKLIAGR